MTTVTAEGQAHRGHFLGPFSPEELALTSLPCCRPGGSGARAGYLPMASRHMTMTAVLNCSMLFWMTMPSMARPV